MSIEKITSVFDLLPKSNCGHFDLSAIEPFKEAILLSEPKKILEIGFHAGHSAVLWLALSKADLLSVDPAIPPWLSWGETQKSIQIINNNFENRLSFIRGKSQDLNIIESINQQGDVDLVSIDGLHEFEACKQDIKLALDLKAKYIFIDDYVISHPCVINAVDFYKNYLQIVKIWSTFDNIQGSFKLEGAPVNSVLVKTNLSL